MRKNFLKIIILNITLIIGILFLSTIKSYAATSISIGTSKSKVAPGESFTVTVSANGAGPVTSTVNNGSGGKNDFLDNSSYSFTCTAGKSGSVTIYAYGVLGDYATGEDTNRSASATVSIEEPVSQTSDPVVNDKPAQKPGKTSGPKVTKNDTVKTQEKSSDATLKELIVEGGTLTPEFNSGAKEYTINVSNDITTLNITATPNDSKAEVSIEGNENFVIGENKVTIKVIAEDGTTNEYYINVVRQKVVLELATLKITYVDKDGNTKEISLNPNFNPAILEYSFDEISYLIESLNVEATSNLENAIIEIFGNENLQAGENEITIKLTLKAEPAAEGEEQPEDEVVTYTIKFTKEATPTFLQKIKNWLKGVGGFIVDYFNNNKRGIIVGSLTFCIIAMVALSVYIVIDSRKYKMLISKLGKVSEITKLETAEDSISTEENPNSTNFLEDITKSQDLLQDEISEENKKSGRHF